jgi:two-component system chemotaxis sensor kinase CheA
MNLDEALNIFVIESRELLENMEAALLEIEQAPDDPDLINAIFRAAHTIKGSAGLFGLDHLVSFTHDAENVLDMVRSNALHIDGDFVALLLKVCDHISALVEYIAAEVEAPPEAFQRSAELGAQLKQMAGQPAAAAGPAVIVPQAQEYVRESADNVGTDNWHLSLRFGADVLKQGMDPLSFLRYLSTFGEIVSIVTLTDTLPCAAEMDPEACYFGFEINYRSDADKARIEGAFDFVRDDATIRILPPHSKLEDYLELIESLPQKEMKLGEILVACGTLTETELRTALADQARQREADIRGQSIGEVLVSQHVVQPEVVEAALQKQQQIKKAQSGDAALIRVNAEKLDEHINLIGELIIASAGIGLAAVKGDRSELLEAASVLNRLVESVRDSALQLRMVQIGATFNKFQRVVRDVSKEIGKDIHLEISGAETELDKTVVEKIGDPLTHLVRNSMDHGIEPAELRLARGKPAHGTLRLNAYHDSGSIAIEVSDDGGGLNKEKILAKAIERGLVKPEQTLSESEIHALIFEPGFSTAAEVNNLSGRGVGMDVVRRNITALRGIIEIQSTEGVGTTIRVRLPLTLAIIDGFLVRVGQSSFVVPLEMVVECVELTPAEIAASQGRNQINLRGEVLPFIRLRELFDIPEPPPTELNAEETGLLNLDPDLAALLQPTRRENVVVVNYAGIRTGLVVDALLGEYQTVIRPLGAVFNGLQGLSGFTLLGSGQVALILDVPSLIKRIAGRENTRNTQATHYALAE